MSDFGLFWICSLEAFEINLQQESFLLQFYLGQATIFRNWLDYYYTTLYTLTTGKVSKRA